MISPEDIIGHSGVWFPLALDKCIGWLWLLLHPVFEVSSKKLANRGVDCYIRLSAGSPDRSRSSIYSFDLGRLQPVGLIEGYPGIADVR